MRKKHSEQFKFKIAVLAVKGDMTLAELCRDYEISPSLVHKWKKQLLEQGVEVFAKSNGQKSTEQAAHAQQMTKLYEKIGQLTIERDFLKKSWARLSGKIE